MTKENWKTADYIIVFLLACTIGYMIIGFTMIALTFDERSTIAKEECTNLCFNKSMIYYDSWFLDATWDTIKCECKSGIYCSANACETSRTEFHMKYKVKT